MKSFKRIAALCLAVGMILTAASTALAATVTGKLVVHGNKEFVGKTVTAIRMFSATYVDAEGGTPDQIDGSDTISYTLEGAWEGLFAAGNAIEGQVDVSGSTGDTLAEKAYDYVRQLTDGNETSTLATFAKQAAAYAKTNAQALATLTYSATAEADADGKGATATFETMEVGYYLVLPEGGSTSVDRQTRFHQRRPPDGRHAGERAVGQVCRLEHEERIPHRDQGSVRYRQRHLWGEYHRPDRRHSLLQTNLQGAGYDGVYHLHLPIQRYPVRWADL